MDSNRRPLVIALIPAFNEEASIAKVILQSRNHVSIVVVCDDGSTDMTGEIAKTIGAIVVRHEVNLGKGAALRTLFRKARGIAADIAVTLDADGQHDPNEIPKLIKAMQTSGADIVVGSRFTKGGNNNSNVPSYRVLGNKVLSFFTDRRLTDTQSGFRVYRKAALNSLCPTGNGMGADSEILMKAKETNLKIVETQINVNYDVTNPSKQNFILHASQVVLSVVKHFSIRRPLLFYGIPSVAALIIASGLWICVIRIFITTKQIFVTLAAAALGTTVMWLMLLITSVTAWVFTREPRKGLRKKEESA